MATFREVRKNPSSFQNLAAPPAAQPQPGVADDGPGEGAEGPGGAADLDVEVPVNSEVADLLQAMTEQLGAAASSSEALQLCIDDEKLSDDQVVARVVRSMVRYCEAKQGPLAPLVAVDTDRFAVAHELELFSDAEHIDEEHHMHLVDEEQNLWMHFSDMEPEDAREAALRHRQIARRERLLEVWESLSERQKGGMIAFWGIEQKALELYILVEQNFDKSHAASLIKHERWTLLFRHLAALRRFDVFPGVHNIGLETILMFVETLELALFNERVRARVHLPGVVAGSVLAITSCFDNIEADVLSFKSEDDVRQAEEILRSLVDVVEDRANQEEADIFEALQTVEDVTAVVSAVEQMVSDIESGRADYEYEGPPLVFTIDLLSDSNPYKRQLQRGQKSSKHGKKEKGVRFAAANDVREIASAADVRKGFLVGDEDVATGPSQAEVERKLRREARRAARAGALAAAQQLAAKEEDYHWTVPQLIEKAQREKLPAYALFPEHFKRAVDVELSMSTTKNSDRSDPSSFTSDGDDESSRSRADQEQDAEELRQEEQTLREIFTDLRIPERYLAGFSEQEIRLEDLDDLENGDVEKLIPEKDAARRFNEWRKTRAEENKRIRDAKENASKQGQVANVPDNLRDIFNLLKIPSRHVDVFYANGKKLSDVINMGNSELKKLLPSRGPRVRLAAFLRNNKSALKGMRKQILERENKDEAVERVHSVQEYAQWIREHEVKESMREEQKLKHAEDQHEQPGEAPAEDIVIHFPEYDGDVNVQEEAVRVLKDTSGDVDRWDTVLRISERGFASVSEIHNITKAFEPCKKTENIYLQEYEELTGAAAQADQARWSARQKAVATLERKREPSRACTTVAADGCSVM